MFNLCDKENWARAMQFRGKHFSIGINIERLADLEAEVKARLQSGRGFALATMNVDHLVKLGRSREFAEAYSNHDLIVADGNPVVWVAKVGGQQLELITGSDQVIPMSRWATEWGAPIALVGSTKDALKTAAKELASIVPGANIVTTISPPFGFDPKGALADEILAQVHASGAKVCFLALGAPKQEIFAARGYQQYADIGFASVGAGLDFIAKHQKRAPKWVRKIAMEWLWRMLSNPRRMVKRYIDCAIVLPGHLASAASQRNSEN